MDCIFHKIFKGRFLNMKNKWLVDISVLLIFGFILTGCATNASTDKGITYNSMEITSQPKSLKITGFPEPSVRTLAVITIRDGVNPWEKPPLASAGVSVRAGVTDYTFTLRVGDDPWNNDAETWTGSGECLIWLQVYRNDSWEPIVRQTRTEYPFVGGTNDVVNFTFTNEAPSVTFSFKDDFREMWW